MNKWAIIPKEAFDLLVQLAEDMKESPGASRRDGQTITRITSQAQILDDKDLGRET